MTTTSESFTPRPILAALCVDGAIFDTLARSIRYLCIGLVDQAVQLRVVSDDPRAATLSLGPIRTVLHRPIRWPYRESRQRQLVQALGQPVPNVVHALGSGSYRLAASLAETCDAELVLQVTSLADGDAARTYSEVEPHALVAMSAPLRDILVEQLGLPGERTELIRAGVLSSGRVAAFADPQRPVTIVSFTPLDRGRGVDLLIGAIQLLHDRGLNPMLFLLGTGREDPAMRRMVRQSGLSHAVTFATATGEMTQVLEHTDIFVDPDPSPVLTEGGLLAMAHGIAVVAMPNAVCDYYRDRETALVCPEAKVTQLAGVLEGLIMDHAEARRIAEGGLAYVREHHSMSVMAERTAALYRRLVLAQTTFSIGES